MLLILNVLPFEEGKLLVKYLGFLWYQGELRIGSAKVAWEVVCLPKDEGGLGRDVILHGAWNWPSYLCVKYPNLSMLAVPNIMENTPNRLVWQNVQGIDKPFSVTQ
ncbi:hypothetical protein Tco_0675997, partial [Tanacetum coccineum]